VFYQLIRKVLFYLFLCTLKILLNVVHKKKVSFIILMNHIIRYFLLKEIDVNDKLFTEYWNGEL
jgi:hypothetical protein